MRHESHRTLVGSLRDAVQAWRKREGWSRETVVQQIVEAHDAMNGPALTGIVFDPQTRDAFDRMKVNADRVFRWLDDETKDGNHIPPNFIPSIIGALPLDLRMACMDEIIRPAGLGVRCLDAQIEDDFNAPAALQLVLKEDHESHEALAGLLEVKTPEALAKAHKEISESIETQTKVRRLLETALNKVGNAFKRAA